MSNYSDWSQRIGEQGAHYRRRYIASHVLLALWAVSQIILLLIAVNGRNWSSAEALTYLVTFGLIGIVLVYLDALFRRKVVRSIRVKLHLKPHVRVPDVCIFRLKAFDYWTRKIRIS